MNRKQTGALGLRVLFLVVVAAAAWWGLREHVDEIEDALTVTPWWRLGLSLALVSLGLAVTGLVWWRVLGAHGVSIPLRGAFTVFFVGQLGKYVPGSVWSMGVQARMAQRFDAPVRTTVSASLVFLVVHVATGLVVGALALSWTALDPLVRLLGVLCCLSLGVVALVPRVVQGVGRRTAGRVIAWGPRESAVTGAAMGLAWLCYVSALVPLAADPSLALVAPLAAAFALGYVAGVAVPVAPAGLGAREVVFLMVLVPTLGVAEAAALALMARVVHTAGDFLAAGVAWLTRHAAQR